MATRRVKRIKRTKKQVHRARGRKTNRRCRRYTRRQRGGRIITVCEKSGFFEAVASGIVITYDDETHMFKIGSDDYETVEQLEKFKGAARYKRAVSVLNHMGETSTQLNWYNFARFANMYCPNAADPQCAQITAFVDSHRSSRIEDKNSTFVGRIIQDSIKYGQNDNKHSDTGFKLWIDMANAAASGAAASATDTDTDSKKILINENGVQLRRKYKTWSRDVCEIDDDGMPFTKCVFIKNTTDHSVSVKYVMSSDARTFCALANYTSLLYERTTDYSFISPSVTIRLIAKERVPQFDITGEFDHVYVAIKSAYEKCAKPYTGSYEFYQEKNPLIAIFYFTKPPKMVYTPIVYQNHIQNLINSCVDQIKLNRQLFTDVETTPIVDELETFKQRLKELKELRDDPKPNLEALKILDNEVNTYVRVTFQRLLVQKTKEQSLASKFSKMSIGAAGAAGAGAGAAAL
jgi:hypothetical protein